MKKSGTATKYPGVSKLGPKKYRVRAKYTDPRTGKQKEVDRILDNVTLRQAQRRRTELLEEARTRVLDEKRVRVGEFARSWIASKMLKIDPGSARTYADALELHILPAFGEFYYDALTSRDVQAWVDHWLTAEYVDTGGQRKPYTRNTVHGWYRVFHTMTHDAVHQLGLPRNPTMRITFPPPRERQEPNALTPEELARFLEAMRKHYPQHYAIVATLAYTGLRFCHVSAFRWDDWDEDEGALIVARKNVNGRIGPVSRKKRAPRVIPILPELAEVLREHRARLERDTTHGLAEGWMFPNTRGSLRRRNTLYGPFQRCLAHAGIDRRVTIHGMRYTFTDLTRRANVDPVVRRAMIGHVTEHMQHHYSTVGFDEKWSAAEHVAQLAPLRPDARSSRTGRGSGSRKPTRAGRSRDGDRGGDPRRGGKEGLNE